MAACSSADGPMWRCAKASRASRSANVGRSAAKADDEEAGCGAFMARARNSGKSRCAAQVSARASAGGPA
eukprot:37-Eustigmatos_ZCMA.PRE.1